MKLFGSIGKRNSLKNAGMFLWSKVSELKSEVRIDYVMC